MNMKKQVSGDTKVIASILGCYGVIALGVIVFWAAVILAVIHFVHKLW